MRSAKWPDGAMIEQAAHWHALQRAGDMGPAQQARFMDWLVASPDHLHEYLAVARMAGELGDALRAMQIDLEALLVSAAPPPRTDNVVALPVRQPARVPPARGKRRGVLLQAIAATVVLACVGVAARMAWPQAQHYVAAHGAPRSFRLPDHTVVHLNAESALSVRFNPFKRQVVLDRGQASFIVASGHRPFEVQAAALRVRDIGTTFDVSLLRDQARIDVAQGQVQVFGAEGGGRPLADLRAGQGARIDYRDEGVSLHQVDVGAMTAWWQGRVVFRDTPLREVAEQFNRLNHLRLALDDDAVGALRLTGNLRGDELASLRAFLDDQPTLVTRVDAQVLHVATRDMATNTSHHR